MFNSKTNRNGGANANPGNVKKPSEATKKMAMRNVKNPNGRHRENLADSKAKARGIKRLATPEPPSSSPSNTLLADNAVNEHIVNARRRFELELGRGRMYNNVDIFPGCPQSSQPRQLQCEIRPQITHLSESSMTLPPPFPQSSQPHQLQREIPPKITHLSETRMTLPPPFPQSSQPRQLQREIPPKITHLSESTMTLPPPFPQSSQPRQLQRDIPQTKTHLSESSMTLPPPFPQLSQQPRQLQREIPPKITHLSETSMTLPPPFPQSSQPRHLQREIPPNITHSSESSMTLPPPFPKSSQPRQLQRDIPQKKTNLLESITTLPPLIPYRVPVKSSDEQKIADRFIRLQKFLKQCDDSSQSDYVEMLGRLSPNELSRHATELEKRNVQLAIEEGKEIQRMKALNILEKPTAANKPLQTSHQLYEK